MRPGSRSREWRGNIIVKAPEEARAAVRAKKAAGYPESNAARLVVRFKP